MTRTKPATQPPLRFSTPPYWIAKVDGELPFLTLPGDSWATMERIFAPSAEEVRGILVRMRRELRWPRSALAAFLGVNRDVVRRWETGQRNPTGAARRLIWLVHLLVMCPGKLKDGMDLIFWGRCEEIQEFSEALQN